MLIVKEGEIIDTFEEFNEEDDDEYLHFVEGDIVRGEWPRDESSMLVPTRDFDEQTG